MTDTTIDDTLHRLAPLGLWKECIEPWKDKPHPESQCSSCWGKGYVLPPRDSRGQPSEAAMLCLDWEQRYVGTPEEEFWRFVTKTDRSLWIGVILATEWTAFAAGFLEARDD